MKKSHVRASFSFVEMMVVMLIIGIISGTVAYNMRGGIDQAKKLQVSFALQTLQTALTFEAEQGGSEIKKLAAQNKWQEAIDSLSMIDAKKKTEYKNFLEQGLISIEYHQGHIEVKNA